MAHAVEVQKKYTVYLDDGEATGPVQFLATPDDLDEKIADWASEHYEAHRVSWRLEWSAEAAGKTMHGETVVHPVEPDCTEPAHDYAESRVPWPAGAGFVYRSECKHCGLERKIETRYLDPCQRLEWRGDRISYEVPEC